MKKRPLILMTALFLLLTPIFLFSGRAQAEERIISFHSDIVVNSDATLDVRETIRAASEGIIIRHGIYRDFPTRYQDRYGNAYKVDFTLGEVLRDGRREPYRLEGRSNGIRIYIGDKDKLLPSGIYTYTLSYRTDRQLGYFEDHDELYWNVTGNGWEFPIESASAAITPPPGAGEKVISLGGYTGPAGSTAANLTGARTGDGRVAFSTTIPLAPREGLTIFLTWPKGFAAEPTPSRRAGYLLRDNLGFLVGLLGLALLLIYYISVWRKVGRDPKRGTIIPYYEPPEGLSPGAMRYITRMGYDNRAFAAAVINMAVKGFLRIEEEDGSYRLTGTGKDGVPLSDDEIRISVLLLHGRESLKLENENHKLMQKAIKAFKDILRAKYEKVYFNTNSNYLIPGLLITILALMTAGAAMVLSGNGPAAGMSLFFGVWLSIWSLGLVALLRETASRWGTAMKGPGNRMIGIGVALFFTLFSIPFVGAEIFALGMLGTIATPLFAVVIAAMAGVNILFYYLLKAPTPAGREILDRIEGFRIYLSVAEKDRLNFFNPPESTPELFEKFLPYALALGVEHAWAENFSGIFAASATQEKTWHPAWYSGSNWSAPGAGGFASSLGGAFSGAISSAATAPGSSSGSGGSSGGGGGGGGGGGW